jgi:hypothetical protein
MSPRVISNFVPFRENPANQIWIRGGVFTDQKEGGFDIALLQHLQ